MRLDQYLVTNNLVESRTKGKYEIEKGNVKVNSKVVTRSSYEVNETDKVELDTLNELKYVSKGGLKLEKALGRKVDCIGCNSGFISIDNKMVQAVPMDNQKMMNLIYEMKKEKPAGFILMSEDYNMVLTKKDFTDWVRIGFQIYMATEVNYGEKYTISDEIFYKEIMSGKVYKLMAFFGVTKKDKLRAREVNEKWSKKFTDFAFSWAGEAIEISAKDCTKANGIKNYINLLGIDKNEVAVIGDSGNDISMFSEFQNSFCMDHAPLSVSKYANNVIKRVSNLSKYIS